MKVQRPGHLAVIALGLVVGAWGCIAREHPLAEGQYQFVLEPGTGLNDDGCGLAAAGQTRWTGSFTVSGDFLRLTYDPLEVTLVGSYGEVSDAFNVAGTRGPLSLALPSGRCDVDTAQVLLDGTTDAPNAFHGTLQVRYEKRNSDACSCQTRTTYRASR